MGAIKSKWSALRNLEKRIIRSRGVGAASSFIRRDHLNLGDRISDPKGLQQKKLLIPGLLFRIFLMLQFSSVVVKNLSQYNHKKMIKFIKSHLITIS